MEKKRKKNVSKYLALVVFLIGYAIVLLIIYPPQRQMNETAKHLTIFSSLSELDFLKADGEIVPDDEPISGAMECVRMNVKYQNHTFAVEAYKFDHIDSARTWFSEYSGWYDAEISEEFYRNWEPFREAFL